MSTNLFISTLACFLEISPNLKEFYFTIKDSMAEPLTPPLHKDPGIPSHRRSQLPVWCRGLGYVLEADQATWAVLLMLLALHPWHQTARPHVEQRGPQGSQPAQNRVHLASGATALGWPHHKDGRRMLVQSTIMVLQESVTKTSWRDCLHRWESDISHGSRGL